MISSTNSQQLASPARNSKAALQKQVRQLHLYLGVFFAPAILFFSLTGSLQLFGLHEGHPGEAYQPPKWVAALASIHKDQVLSRQHGPPPSIAEQGGATPPDSATKKLGGRQRKPQGGEEHKESKATFVLKCFFLTMSIGLIATTLLGVYMAFKYNRNRVVVWGLLIAGVAIPVALISCLA